MGTVHWVCTTDGVVGELADSFWQGPVGRRLAVVIDTWVEDGVAAVLPGNPAVLELKFRLWDRVVKRDDPRSEDERALFDELLPTTPGRWDVGASSYLGSPQFRIELRRNGTLVMSGDTPAIGLGGDEWLTPEALALVRLASRWNAAPSAGLAAQLALVAEIQDARDRCEANGERVVLEAHLAEFDIKRATNVRVAWEPSKRREGLYDLTASVSRADGSGEEPLQLEDLDATQPVAIGPGKKAVLFEPDAARALRHIRGRQQSRSKREVAPVIHDLLAVMPEGVAPESIDLSEYSNRVKGFEPVARAARAQDIQGSGVKWFEGEPQGDEPFLELDVTSSPSAPPVRLRFETPADVDRASEVLNSELARPPPKPVALGGAEVIPTAPLQERLALEMAIFHGGQRDGEPRVTLQAPPRLAAVIDENAVFEGADAAEMLAAVPWGTLDQALLPGMQLKSHQRAGLAWLWYHRQRGCPGVLLADDMGLGKTLQVASLLALTGGRNRGKAGPSLVIAPVVLLDNWRAELSRFFRPEAFPKVAVLHGVELDGYRAGAGLNTDALTAVDLVITNYETLARFQLALLKIAWNVVVLDESHAIKNPDALRTRAACGLKRKFAVCMTGTPVENRLLDLWSHFFFLSPQDPFGSRQSFAGQTGNGAAGVRSALEYPSAKSRVLRRTKAVLDLPGKRIQSHAIPMTDEQVELERRVVRSSDSTLARIGRLRKLYAHPLLLRDKAADEQGWDLESALRLSPKLARCIELLSEIRARGEKALVFSLFIRMQALLVQGIRERLGLARVHVINGDSNQAGRTTQAIADFSNSPGFDVLILSPIAAGVGLNIVAANHVIHYDRWWNPAKEDQATDRAHRIGQTREVNVHYLLLHKPDNPSAGFDGRLHDLVERKRAMAKEFLSPADAMELQEAELHGLLSREAQDE